MNKLSTCTYYKKAIAAILCILMLLPMSAEAAHGTGALNPYPFRVSGRQDEDGNVILTVNNQSACNSYPVEESEFLYIAYIEMELNYGYGYSEDEFGYIGEYGMNALRRSFMEHPERVKCLYERENVIPCHENKTIIAMIFFKHDGKIYKTNSGTYIKPVRVTGFDEDYVPEDSAPYREVYGAEADLSIYREDWTSGNIKYDEYEMRYDITAPAEEESLIYLALYNDEGRLIDCADIYRNSKEHRTEMGDKLWLHRNEDDRGLLSVPNLYKAAYYRVFVWDENLSPIAAGRLTAIAPPEFSTEKTDEGTVLTVTQEDVQSAVIYGPASHPFGGSRYLRSLESVDITEEKTAVLAENGYYLVVLTDSEGVEYKRNIDTF